MTREVQASGAAAAWEEVTVGVELSGLRVASVAVEVGSSVRQRDVLIRIDDRTMDSQLGQAQASVAEANSVLETAQKKARRIRELANKQMVSLQDAEKAESAAVTAPARLNTAIASHNAAQVQPGTPVSVQGPDGDVAGVVCRVSPALDARNRTGTIYADLPQPGALRAGMFAQGRIAQGEASALLIPADAVVRRDGRA